jgi:TRAP-type C4-dicarboxylate transport system permease small subunit
MEIKRYSLLKCFDASGRLEFTEMGWLEKSKGLIHPLNRFIAKVGACFLIPLMLITSTDVLSRDLFGFPLPGTIELSQYLLAIFILLGIAYTQQVKGYVEVTLLTSRLPPRVRSILSIIATLLSVFIISILAWQGWVVGIEERTVSDMLRIPQYPFRILVAVAAFLTCLELLIDLGKTVTNTVRRASS